MRGAWEVSEQTALTQLNELYTEIIEVDKQPFIDAVSDLVNAEAERLGVVDEVNYILEEGPAFLTRSMLFLCDQTERHAHAGPSPCRNSHEHL